MTRGLVSQPLVANAARQAVRSLGGYVYQVWHSLLEWTLLEPDEVLVLEGNEDVDRLRNGEAVSTQIKDTAGSGNLTLRSPDAVDAINNYWTARARNPDVTLRYRFLTTASPGTEQGAPFGGLKGIEVWDDIARPTAPDRTGGGGAHQRVFTWADEYLPGTESVAQ